MNVKPRVLATVAVVALVGAAVVAVWFQPQKLFFDDVVDESVPTRVDAGTGDGQGSDGGATGTTSSGIGPVELARGSFVSLDHGTSGAARVLQIDERTRILRLDALDTSNGPDLFVYLSTNTVDGDEGGFDDDFVNLGRLKGNKGDQNYDLPGDIDLQRFASVVIWCDRFNSAFGAAPLAIG